jgi:hypothetical protein
LVAIVGVIVMKPVTLPPGRGMLATKPLPTGTNMIGMVRVCCRSVAVAGVFVEKISSGLRPDEFFRESLHRLYVGSGPGRIDPDVAALRPR